MIKDILPAQQSRKIKFGLIYKSVIKQLLNKLITERNNDKIYTLLGFCYKKMNKFNKAISYFEKAVTLNQESFSAFYEMGLCGLKQQKTCVAVNSFIKAIQTNPTHPHAVLNLGIAHESCEEPDMAFMVYQRLIETSPNYIKAYEKKAELFINMSLYSDAIPLLNEMVKRNPNHAIAYQKLGNCYKKLGKPTYAYRCFRKILTTDTTPDICAGAIYELKRISRESAQTPARQKIKLC